MAVAVFHQMPAFGLIGLIVLGWGGLVRGDHFSGHLFNPMIRFAEVKAREIRFKGAFEN